MIAADPDVGLSGWCWLIEILMIVFAETDEVLLPKAVIGLRVKAENGYPFWEKLKELPRIIVFEEFYSTERKVLLFQTFSMAETVQGRSFLCLFQTVSTLFFSFY